MPPIAFSCDFFAFSIFLMYHALYNRLFLQVSFVQDTPDVAQKKSHAEWVKATVTVMMNARDTTLAEQTIVTPTDFPNSQITMIAALETIMVRVRLHQFEWILCRETASCDKIGLFFSKHTFMYFLKICVF